MASRGNTQGKRYLYLTVYEASGKTRDNEILWDPSFSEGYIKVEVRGGGKTTKVSTHYQRVDAYSINWSEEIRLEITDAAEELRIMLTTDKIKSENDSGTKRSTAVIAACGIFVSDILDAVPIDKYFELFKPGNSSSGLGGFVHIAMRATSARIAAGGAQPGYHQEHVEAETEPTKKRHWVPLVLLGALTAGVIIALKAVKK